MFALLRIHLCVLFFFVVACLSMYSVYICCFAAGSRGHEKSQTLSDVTQVDLCSSTDMVQVFPT